MQALQHFLGAGGRRNALKYVKNTKKVVQRLVLTGLIVTSPADSAVLGQFHPGIHSCDDQRVPPWVVLMLSQIVC